MLGVVAAGDVRTGELMDQALRPTIGVDGSDFWRLDLVDEGATVRIITTALVRLWRRWCRRREFCW